MPHKLKMKKLNLILFLSLFSVNMFSQSTDQGTNQQTWVQMMQDPTANFYDVQAAFYSYWEGRTIEKGKGYKAFKRWENYMAPRVYPTGNMTIPSQTYTNYKEWERDALINTEKSVSGDWNFLGPVGKPAGGGAGRVNFVRVDPNNSNIIYIGTPDGGLWKSINGGTSWSVLTEQLEAIGCSDIAIDPNNSQILYLASGDSDAGDSYSIGLLKSTDGGVTWAATGMVHAVSQGRTISRVLIDPSNSNTILVAASNGIFRSTNAGGTFTSVSTGGFKDLEFKPGDPTTVYAVGSSFRKSTNNGQTWAVVSSGLTTTGVSRISMAVTAANPAYVYLLYGSSADEGLLGVYRSIDSGTTFTQRADGAPNYLGWNSDASDAGGQAFYDLTIAASPTNAQEIIIGGVNSWKSTNGGTSWSLLSHWTGSGAPYVHADHHDIQYLTGTTIFDCNDGGINKSTNGGTSWTDISANLGIAQQYRIGTSTSTEALLISGHQDNGTNKLSGTTWTEVYGGDGMDCFIDRTNNNTMIGSYVYGEYYKSNNGGNNFTSINNGIPSGDWLSVIHQDPTTANTYYAGGRNAIYKTTNGGTSWTALGTPSGSNAIIEFAIAPSNNQIIYAVKQNSVSKSTNGGTTWTAITTGLPVTSLQPTNLAVSNTDPNVVYVTFSGYNTSSKVFKSTSGGTSWSNISTGLPNVPCNTIVYHNSSTNDAVYLGTDVGVYYKDNTMTTWTMYSTNLPRVSVRDLEIYYPTSRLRAGTFGRGTWDTDLYSSATLPIANFSASSQTICGGQTVTFTNLSSGGATSYQWTFVGGSPATSTAINPTITYSLPGTYPVKLIAFNGVGSDTLEQLAYITVTQGQNLPYNEGFVAAVFPYANWNISDLQGNGTWTRTTDAGNNPTLGDAIIFDNFNIDDRGFMDDASMPTLNLSSSIAANLTFDVAYAPYDAVNFDSLEVLISTDCGLTFSSLYLKGNTVLATAPSISTVFTPSAAQWRTETLNLTPYVGFSNVQIIFRNRAGYGNRIFIDNINVIGTPGIAPTAAFTQNSNSICQGQTVTYTNTSLDNPTSFAWVFQGGNPATSTDANPVVTYSTAGIYDVSLTVTNGFGTNNLTLNNQINVSAAPAIPTISASGPLSFCQGASVTLTASTTSGNTWSTNATSNSIVVTTSGSYTVSNSNGTCSSSSIPTVVTVNAIPNTPLVNPSGATTFCQGGSVTLTSSSATGNNWSTGASTQQIIVNTTTTNITNIVSLNGCSSQASTPITVTVNPLPVVVLNNFASICDTANPLVLNTGTPTGGTYSGTGVTSGSFNPGNVSLGVHTITYSFTNSNNCTATDQATITVVLCAGVGVEDASLNGFVIYPNPTQDYLILKGDKLKDFSKIEILNLEGKVIKSFKIDSTEMKLDLTQFAAGFYNLKISNSSREIVEKIQIIK